MLMLLTPAVFAEEATEIVELKEVTVKIDGVLLEIADQKPIIENDRTLVPLRVVSESLGCTVDWNGETYEVTVNTPEHLAVVAETDRIRAIEPTFDGAYKTTENGVRLPIKLYIPEEGENKKIAVLAIHGGSW